jgi:hypothetical protein
MEDGFVGFNDLFLVDQVQGPPHIALVEMSLETFS